MLKYDSANLLWCPFQLLKWNVHSKKFIMGIGNFGLWHRREMTECKNVSYSIQCKDVLYMQVLRGSMYRPTLQINTTSHHNVLSSPLPLYPNTSSLISCCFFTKCPKTKLEKTKASRRRKKKKSHPSSLVSSCFCWTVSLFWTWLWSNSRFPRFTLDQAQVIGYLIMAYLMTDSGDNITF